MPTVDELTELARELPAAEKLKLVDSVLLQLDMPDSALDAVWAGEVSARREAYLAGKLESSSYEEVMQSFRGR